jgi:hypothetical protein
MRVEDPLKKKSSQPASHRIAAHQSGKAIAAVASKFEVSPRGVKYVIAVETVFCGFRSLLTTGPKV